MKCQYIFCVRHFTRSSINSLLTPCSYCELMMMGGITSVLNGTGSYDFSFASRKRSLSSIPFQPFIFWLVPDACLFNKAGKGTMSLSHSEWALRSSIPMFALFLYPVARLELGGGKQGTYGAKFKEVSLSASSALLASPIPSFAL